MFSKKAYYKAFWGNYGVTKLKMWDPQNVDSRKSDDDHNSHTKKGNKNGISIFETILNSWTLSDRKPSNF